MDCTCTLLVQCIVHTRKYTGVTKNILIFSTTSSTQKGNIMFLQKSAAWQKIAIFLPSSMFL